MVRKTSGRKKIDIEKIEREDYLQVAFSKRRGGLFKKASELCTLCGAETAVVVFSPAGKAFSFGHPSVGKVFDRFLANESPSVEDHVPPIVDARRSMTAKVCQLNQEYMVLLNQLEAEKKRGQKLKTMNKDSQENYWWNGPIENLNLDELEKLMVSMEEIKMGAVTRANELMIASSLSFMEGGRVNPFATITNETNASYYPHQDFDFSY